MSWSVGAIGKAAAVRAAIAKQFADGSKCLEPEETVRQAAAAAIDGALAAQDPGIVVKVLASGSQFFKDYTTKTGIQNSLSLTVEPLSGFIE